MVAKNTAETDEQIIDLTELIEKGEVPANDPSAQPLHNAAEAEVEQEKLQEHLRSLNDGSKPADAEIDDLLAQMDVKSEGQEDPADVALDFSAPSTQTDHPIDPNEQLNMPGMGDVDNLLNSLDIPPQPSEREPEAAEPETADQAVDALLNDFNAPAGQAPAGNGEPDLDELLAAVAGPLPTGGSSHIDDLLDAAHPAAPAAPAEAAADNALFSSDALDSMLHAAATGVDAATAPAPAPAAAPMPAPAPAPAPAAAPMSAPAPAPAPAAAPMSAPAPAAAPAAKTGTDFDIDSLLAAAAEDLQSSAEESPAEATPAPQAEVAAAKPAATQTASQAAPQAAAPAAAPAPSAAAKTNMDFDIDSLLAAAAEETQNAPDANPQPDVAAPAPQPSSEPAPQPAPMPAAAAAAKTNMDFDIDSLLAAAAEETQNAPDANPQPDVAAPAPQPSSEPVPQPAPMPAAAAAAKTDMDFDIDSLLAAAAEEPQDIPGEAQPQVAPQAAAAASAQPEAGYSNDDLDSLLASAAAGLDAAAPAPQPESAATAPAAAAPELEPPHDLNVDLDSLLAAVSGDQPPAGMEQPQPVQDEEQAQAQAPVAEQAEPDMLLANPAQTAPQEEQAPELTTDFNALQAAAKDEPLPADAPQDVAVQQSPEIMQDIMPDVLPEPQPAPQPEPQPEALPVMLAQDDMPDDTENAGQAEQQPDFLPAPLDETDPSEAESQAVLDATLAAASAEALETVMAQAKEASSHALDAFAQAFDASSRAADAAEAASKLAERVEQCERALQEAGERIIALETALESQIAASHELAAAALPRQELEGMFMEGHPLHQGLIECIGRAVTEAMAAMPAAAPAPQSNAADVQAIVDERLQPVITAARSATARIDALEIRLDALEPRFNDRVERAAAAAAARILREEIGRLLEDQ
ncbi:hypothetical protein DDIC_01835 [Desulfovibrio desulfuricans]|uniref:Meckel syndrome type 1 protein n=1 Tax=Desulfovibrio desulfuricans TaxID=876 RepID=A0A4V1CX15_DESDE|nr:hypothetical protein [Desulfovibrio desulfuricans]QCC84640.1 hypothetical protein DDIC_01835 [Desulfovibrio desulfuricans]